MVVDFDGAGNDYTGRITAINSTGASGTFEVSPAPSATFSGKAIKESIWGRKLFPSGTTGFTAVLSDDGTQAYLSDVTRISVGTWLFFGAIGRRTALGVRKVTALAGSTATLDRAIDWQEVNRQMTYAAFGGTGLARPSVPIEFGFWLRADASIANDLGPTITVTYASPLSGSGSYKEDAGSGGVGRFNAPSPYYKADGSDGTYGQILHELGEVDAGIHPIGIGDSFRLEATAWIDEFAPTFAADPVASGKAELNHNSYLASLGIGART